MKACLITALLPGLLIALPLSAEPGWGRLRVPGFWEAEHGGTIKSHDGYAWYRCFVKVPANWKGGALSLSLGRIDDCDETYFNGHRIGGMGSLKPYRTASGIDRRYVVAPARVNYGLQSHRRARMGWRRSRRHLRWTLVTGRGSREPGSRGRLGVSYR